MYFGLLVVYCRWPRLFIPCFCFNHDSLFQVGNAVPPPMSKQIGLEIKKCLKWKAENEAIKPNSGKVNKEEAVVKEEVVIKEIEVVVEEEATDQAIGLGTST